MKPRYQVAEGVRRVGGVPMLEVVDKGGPKFDWGLNRTIALCLHEGDAGRIAAALNEYEKAHHADDS